MRQRTRSLLLVLALASIAGCGSSSGSSSSSSSSTLSPAAWRAHVNAICTATNAKLKAMPPGTTSSAAGLQKVVLLEQQGATELSTTPPPPSLARQANAWLNTLTQAVHATTQLVNALQENNSAQVKPALERSRTLTAQSRAQAEALGLKGCTGSANPGGR